MYKAGKHKAFTLLEVMIAMSILAVGMLSTSMLITRATRSNLIAYEHATANQLLNWMEESMRSNANGAPGYQKSPTAAGACQQGNVTGTILGKLEGTANQKGLTGCTPIAKAQDDIQRWKKLVQDTLSTTMGLSSVNATIAQCSTDCKNKSPGKTGYVLTIEWSSNLADQDKQIKRATRQVIL